MVWDGRTRQILHTLRGHTDAVAAVAFRPDGRWLASAGADRAVRVWDVRTGQQRLAFRGHGASVRSVAFHPDGNRVASCAQSYVPDAAGGGRDVVEVKVWDARTGQECLSLTGLKQTVISVAFSPDGKLLATSGRDGALSVRDADTGKVLFSRTVPYGDGWSDYGRVAFSPRGKVLAVLNGASKVRVWDLPLGRELLTVEASSALPLIAGTGALAFSPDGQRLVCGGIWVRVRRRSPSGGTWVGSPAWPSVPKGVWPVPVPTRKEAK
jgi:WD40 repeat protein